MPILLLGKQRLPSKCKTRLASVEAETKSQACSIQVWESHLQEMSLFFLFDSRTFFSKELLPGNAPQGMDQCRALLHGCSHLTLSSQPLQNTATKKLLPPSFLRGCWYQTSKTVSLLTVNLPQQNNTRKEGTEKLPLWKPSLLHTWPC